MQGRFVRATSGDGSPHLEGSFDSGSNSSQHGREIEIEAEAEGLTSSEEGEAEMETQPMEVVEGPSNSSVNYCVKLQDTDSKEADGQQVAADIASGSSGSSIRVKSRVKQNLSGGESSSLGPILMGSAAEGMKAFWGAIHDTTSSEMISSAVVASPSSNVTSATLTEVGGSSVAYSIKDNSGVFAVDDENDDDSGDEARDLCDENGEMLHEESGSKKRFRRHTIAY